MSSTNRNRSVINKTLLVESLLIMLFAAFLFAITFGFEEVPPILAQGVAPTAFPRAIIALMFGLAALQGFKAVRLSISDIAKLKPHKSVPRSVYLTALLLIVFFISMPIIGTFPTLILFCPALALLWGERRWLLMLLSFGGFIAFVYLLFVLVLDIPLP